MRPGEFWEAIEAYKEEKSADRRHIGELVRGATLRLFNLHVDKRYRTADPHKFWAMPWDEEKESSESKEIQRLSHLGKADARKEVDKFFERINHGRRISKPES